MFVDGGDYIPLLMVREPDWRKYDSFLKNKNNKEFTFHKDNMFSAPSPLQSSRHF